MLPDRLVIRRLNEGDDLEALTTLLHRAYRPLLDAGMNFNASRQNVETTRERVSDGACFVAELDGQIVGTVTLSHRDREYLPDYYRRPGVWRFGQFAVEPTLQKCRIGEALMNLIERKAKEGGATELALDTAIPAEHLVRYYERRGFRIVDRHSWPGLTYDSHIMSKRL